MRSDRDRTWIGRGAIVCALVLATLSVRPVLAEQEFLKFGHNQQKSHVYQAVAEYFASEVDNRLDDVSIKIFPNAQLGEEVPMMENVIAGNQDIVIAASAWASTFVEPLGFFSVSYLFPTQEDFRKVLNDNQFNQLIDDKIIASGIKLKRIATVTAGVRNLYSSENTVKSIDDVKGLRLRVMGSPIESEVWSTMGTSPFSIPFSDVYSALHAGLAKGAENTVASYAASKHYEVAPYYSLTGHQRLIAFVFIGEDSWNRISKKQQEVLLEIGREMPDFSIDYTAKGDQEELEKLVENFGVVVSEVDSSGFSERVKLIQDSVSERLGMEDVLARIREQKQ